MDSRWGLGPSAHARRIEPVQFSQTEDLPQQRKGHQASGVDRNMDREEAKTIINEVGHDLVSLSRFIAWMPVPNSGRLYHYTTSEGLKGILESKCLHATAASFLNDSSEIAYGCSILHDVLDAKKSERANSNESTVRLVEDLLQIFCNDAGRATWSQMVFVTCFCEQDNLLSQWRAYGQDGGYSLEFHISEENTLRLRPEPNAFTSILVPVLYHRNQQIEACNALLTLILDTMSVNQLDDAFSLEESSYIYDRIRGVVADLLIEEILAWKHPAFQEEREWRLVSRKREVFRYEKVDAREDKAELHFRTKRGLIVPYIKLQPAQGPLQVSSITIGPTLDKKKAQPGLGKLLEANGFRDVQIDGSEIPVVL